MKKLFAIAVLTFVLSQAKAEDLKFNYNAGADAVSCFIWRGLYEGGLSLQPQVSFGWANDNVALDLGAWGSVGASDWGFRKGLPVTEDGNPNTQLVKELDIIGSVSLWGVMLGFTHYYYFDGENFFNFGDVNTVRGSAQTEINLGYDFSTLLPNLDLQLSWNTMVAGSDAAVNGRRCFSTYIEASYCHSFEHEISLTGVVGFSPWRSKYTDADDDENSRDFAFNNLTLRLDKNWKLSGDSCSLGLFVQGTMNTCNLNKDNAIIRASGDNKLEAQKLMAAVGINFTFGK